MKKRAVLFNRGIAGNLTRRFWLLQAAYFAVLLLLLPAAVYNGLVPEADYSVGELNITILQQTRTCVFAAAAGAILVVMAVYSWLFTKKTAFMMASFPVKRDTLFCTAWLTGLVPMLAGDVLAVGVMSVILPAGSFSPSVLWQALAMLLEANIAFFGFAAFCAVLTGNIIILPALYAVLEMTAFVAERCIRALLGVFVYGMSVNREYISYASPFYYLTKNLSVVYTETGADEGIIAVNPELSCGRYIFFICIAGVLFSVFALFVFRTRNMESATDAVAVPVLRPVFRYCMTFGCAVVFAGVAYKMFLGSVFHGFSSALAIVILLCLGAGIGWFTAEMLMKKTLKVFNGRKKGLLIMCACLAATVIFFEADVTGYEKTVPDAASVNCLQIYVSGAGYPVTELYGSEDISAAEEVHREIIGDKKTVEAYKGDNRLAILNYFLKDGSVISRRYYLPALTEDDNGESLLVQLTDATNTESALLSRLSFSGPLKEKNIASAEICYQIQYNGGTKYLELSPSETEELYNSCILPDVQDGAIYTNYTLVGDEYMDIICNTSIIIYGANEGSCYIEVTADAERTVSWLRENTDIPVQTLRHLKDTELVIFEE